MTDGSIWMIEATRYSTDIDNYPVNDSLIEDEYGWFGSLEKAQEFCDAQNAPYLQQYADYVAQINRSNTASRKKYEAATSDIEFLNNSGRHSSLHAPMLVTLDPLDLDTWLRDRSRSEWSPIEVPPHQEE